MKSISRHSVSVFIFRRDLRLDDNTGLIKALTESETVIPLFILTPTQVSNQNSYKSSNAVQFMMESLIDLDKQIHANNSKHRLWVWYGDEIPVLNRIRRQYKYTAIYVNADYTPYAIHRDKAIAMFCVKKRIQFVSNTDILLLDTLSIKSGNDTYYKIFTQFYHKILSMSIRKPNYYLESRFQPIPIIWRRYNIGVMNKWLLSQNYYKINPQIAIHGGRAQALILLKNLAKFRTYFKTRDQIAIPTTHLSPHNKFGTVSIREVYWTFKLKAKSKDLITQLYWRDFYYYAGVHFKGFYQHQHLTRHVKIVWPSLNRSHLTAWQEGKTGFPIVDAAMRELNITGFMHNRGRLIVASFLVKDLLINWIYGERYFSQKLIDIDRAQNTGNWNWSSSFGLDATPFLRIFNPWTQSVEADPDSIYIKKWIPELAEIPATDLHQWSKSWSKYLNITYPKPMVDHRIQRMKFVKLYNRYFKRKL